MPWFVGERYLAPVMAPNQLIDTQVELIKHPCGLGVCRVNVHVGIYMHFEHPPGVIDGRKANVGVPDQARLFVGALVLLHPQRQDIAARR